MMHSSSAEPSGGLWDARIGSELGARMQQMRFELREDVHDMHLDVVRLLSDQQQWMQAHFAQFGAQLHGLAEENRQLRAENEMLRDVLRTRDN